MRELFRKQIRPPEISAKTDLAKLNITDLESMVKLRRGCNLADNSVIEDVFYTFRRLRQSIKIKRPMLTIAEFHKLHQAADTLPRLARILSNPQEQLGLTPVTNENQQAFVSLLNELDKQGAKFFENFPLYFRWRETLKDQPRSGPLTVCADTLSPFSTNEDAFGMHQEKITIDGKVYSYWVCIVADGRKDIATRNRYIDPPSEAGYKVVKSILERCRTRWEIEQAVIDTNDSLYRNNNSRESSIYFRHDPLKFHGSSFIAAQILTPLNNNVSERSWVCLTQVGSGCATGTRANGSLSRRIEGLPATKVKLGLEASIHPRLIKQKKFWLHPGDKLMLSTDGVEVVCDEIIRKIMNSDATPDEKLLMTLWASQCSIVGRNPLLQLKKDEATALIIHKPPQASSPG